MKTNDDKYYEKISGIIPSITSALSLTYSPRQQVIELKKLKKEMISNALDASKVDSFIEIIESGFKRVCGDLRPEDRSFDNFKLDKPRYRPKETDKDKYNEHC